MESEGYQEHGIQGIYNFSPCQFAATILVIWRAVARSCSLLGLGPAFAALCLLVGWNLMNRVNFEAFLPQEGGVSVWPFAPERP
jgi:hypothetical protein